MSLMSTDLNTFHSTEPRKKKTAKRASSRFIVNYRISIIRGNEICQKQNDAIIWLKLNL